LPPKGMAYREAISWDSFEDPELHKAAILGLAEQRQGWKSPRPAASDAEVNAVLNALILSDSERHLVSSSKGASWTGPHVNPGNSGHPDGPGKGNDTLGPNDEGRAIQ